MGRKKKDIIDKCKDFLAKQIDNRVSYVHIQCLYDCMTEVLNKYMWCHAQHNNNEEKSKFFGNLKNSICDFFGFLEQHTGYVEKQAVLFALIATLYKYDKEFEAERKSQEDAREKRIDELARGYIFGTEYTLFDPPAHIYERAKQLCADNGWKIPILPSKREKLRNAKK